MQYVAWLIDEAWDHHRRRRLRTVAVCAGAALIAIVLVTALYRPGAATRSVAPGPLRVAPNRVLSRSPYLGVRCPIPNSIACDRVGLAVWLKQPAVSVTATIAGAPVALDRFGEEPLSFGVGNREFAGYLKPAGIVSRLHIHPVDGTEVLTRHGRTVLVNSHRMWFGETGARPPLVRLMIHEASGRTVTTQLRVALEAGWG